MFKFLLALLFDQRGEENSEAGSGAGAPADGGQGGAPGSQDDLGGGSGAAKPPEPKYGEFGDDPDKVWQAYQNQTKEFEVIKGKTTATEKNLSALRKTLEGSGIKVVQDAQGNVQLVAAENDKKPTRQSRFTDEHRTKFSTFFDKPDTAKDFLSNMELFVQDLLDGGLENYQKTQSEKVTQLREFQTTKTQANGLLVNYFPQLIETDKEGNKNPNYNKAFWDRATEIYEEKYERDPRGELLAALEAAVELGIPAQQVSQAKKAGYQAGKQDKKILAPVGGGQAGGAGSFKALTKDEYLALSKDKRDEYDAQKLLQGKT